MDVLGSVGQVLLHLSNTLGDESKLVRALATGLRVQSAADDPSGLAISENLIAQISGTQHAIQNVQTAQNALTVADGALQTVQLILQRIRSLTVQARSDINSEGQLQNIQTEIDQLLVEINSVAQNTNFNGRSLLDGSLDSSQGTPARLEIIASDPNPDGTTGANTVVNADGAGNPGPIFNNPHVGSSGQTQVAGLEEIHIIDFNAATGQVDVQETDFSNDPSFGNGQQATAIFQVPVNAGQIPGITDNSPSGNILFVADSLSNITPQDVGASVTFIEFAAKQASGGHALQVSSGANEGDLVSINLPSVSTNALQIAGISVLDPTTVDPTSNTSIGVSSSNNFAAKDAQARVDDALQAISAVRAQVGAQVVSLSEDANNGAISVQNLTAANSNIRDINVGQATSQFTKDQILAQVGTSVVAQLQVSALLATRLIIEALSGGSTTIL